MDRLLNEQARRLQMGGVDIEQYLSTTGKTAEEMREELRPSAEKRVTQGLVLGKVAEEEGIEASEDEIDTEIENSIKNATTNKDELQKALNTPQARESIQRVLTTRKTIERLVEIAGGSAKHSDQSE